MSVRRLAAGSALLLAGACSDPSFVSLGRNAQSVASFGPAETQSVLAAPDAGVSEAPAVCGSAAAADAPAFDDPMTPGADLSFGCEIEQPPEPPAPPVCELVGERVPIASACEPRTRLVCPESEGELARTSSMLFDVIARCTELDYRITVAFDAGCATAFTIEAREALVAPGVSGCIAARLAAERYDCAQAITCAEGNTFPRVTR